MLLSEIEKTYESYNDIYNKLLIDPSSILNDITAKTLLENSLYLSVFTIFESFLKELIENYLVNVTKKGICFTQLSEGVACALFLSEEQRIQHIFDSSDEKKSKAFRSYFNNITNNLTKKDLEKHIHFEFLHENKLNGYYKDLFEQILGDRDFLNTLKLTENAQDFQGLLEIKGDAFTFLREYTSNIRNNIAHQNWNYKIGGFDSFEKITNAFLTIINEIIKKYESYTGFKFMETSKNILEDF